MALRHSAPRTYLVKPGLVRISTARRYIEVGEWKRSIFNVSSWAQNL